MHWTSPDQQDLQTSLYDALQVLPTASTEEVRRAYRRLVQLHHPDRHRGEQDPDAIAHINRAYEVLSDVQLRAQYDASRRRPAPLRRPARRRGAPDLRRYTLQGSGRPRLALLGLPALVLLLAMGLGWAVWRWMAAPQGVPSRAGALPPRIDAAEPAPPGLKLTPARSLESLPRPGDDVTVPSQR